jgi:hypothetical protein
MSPRLRLPSPAMIVACVALAVALAGTATAVVTLPARSVGTKQLKNRAVTPVKIKRGAVTSAHIANGTVQPTDLAAAARLPAGAAGGSLTGNYPSPVLAPSSVGSSEVTDGSLRLADMTVSSATLNWTPLGFTIASHACIAVGVGGLPHEAGDVILTFDDPVAMPNGIFTPPARQATASPNGDIEVCNFTAGTLGIMGTSRFFVLRP